MVLHPEEGTGEGVFSYGHRCPALGGDPGMSGSAHPCALQGCDLIPSMVWSSIRPWDRGQGTVLMLSQRQGLVEAQRKGTDALTGLTL